MGVVTVNVFSMLARSLEKSGGCPKLVPLTTAISTPREKAGRMKLKHRMTSRLTVEFVFFMINFLELFEYITRYVTELPHYSRTADGNGPMTPSGFFFSERSTTPVPAD